MEHDANGRHQIDHERITNLSASIAQCGLLNPITVNEQDDRYRLCAGLNRLRATQLLNWVEIPATILDPGKFNEGLTRLAENAARSNLSPVEEAMQLAPLVASNPNGIDGVAAAIGRSRAWIDSRLEILEWPEALVDAVHEKKIAIGAATRLARIPEGPVRDEYIYNAITHGINTRTAAEWLRQATAPTSEFFATPQGSLPNAFSETETTTTTNCFVCRHQKPIENTSAVRVCHDCLVDLEKHQPNESPGKPTRDPDHDNAHRPYPVNG